MSYLFKSNRQRAGKGQHAARVSKLALRESNLIEHIALRRAGQGGKGQASQSIRTSIASGVMDSKHMPKAMSRIPKAWADTHRVQVIKPVEYSVEHWLSIHNTGLRYNPNPWVDNVQRLRQWDPVKRKHTTRKLEIGMPGEKYRKPASELLWRGPPCLFDECQAMPRIGVLGVKLHQLVGSLPEWKNASVAPPTAREMALEVLIADWRASQQLAYLALLGVDI